MKKKKHCDCGFPQSSPPHEHSIIKVKKKKKKIKKGIRDKIYTLLEQYTRAEIMARLVPLGSADTGRYYRSGVEIMDEIRYLMFGTDDLVALGIDWGLLKSRHKKKKKRSMK